MRIRHPGTFAKRQQSGMQSGVANLAAGHGAAAGHFLQEVTAHSVLARQVALPDQPALGRFGRREVDDDIESACEGGVDAVARVGGDEDDALVVFQPLQEIIGLQVGVAVVGVAYICSIGHQGIALIEQQHHVQLFGAREHLVQVAFGLADVFIDHRCQVHTVEVHLQLCSQHPGAKGLARAAGAAEESAHAARQIVGEGQARVIAQRLALVATCLQGSQLRCRCRADDEFNVIDRLQVRLPASPGPAG